MRLKTIGGIAVALAVAAFPITAHADPMGPHVQCGPGVDWVVGCGQGDIDGDGSVIDHDHLFGTFATHLIDFVNPAIPDFGVTLYQVGDLTIELGDPYAAGGVNKIDTEIVEMTMTGGGVTMRAGAGTEAGPGALGASSGEIEQTLGESSATSFFDVFFELDLTSISAGLYLYNHTAVHLEAEIFEVPPELGTIYSGGNLPLALFIHGAVDPFAHLVSATHTVPAPGAVVLGVMGMGIIGWVKRRFA